MAIMRQVVPPPLVERPRRLSTLCVGLLSAALAAASPDGGPPVQSDAPPRVQDRAASLADLLFETPLCFLAEPVEVVKVPMFGSLQVQNLCCNNTKVQDLVVRAMVDSTDTTWSGAARLLLALGSLDSSCRADWAIGASHHGEVHFEIEQKTRKGRDLDFLNISVDFAGEPFVEDDVRYPWLGNTSLVECFTSVDLGNVAFTGASKFLEKVLAKLVEGASGMIDKTICDDVPKKLLPAVNTALAHARGSLEKLILDVPGDLPPPRAPEGAGPIYNLQSSPGWMIVTELLESGFNSGGMQELMKNATNGTGDASLSFGDDPLQMGSVSAKIPLNVSAYMFAEGGWLGGLDSMRMLDFAAPGPGAMNVTFSETRMNLTFDLWAGLATASGWEVSSGLVSLFSAAGVDTLLERYTVHTSLAGVEGSARLGALFDQQQVERLAQGTGWSATECLPTMLQNASLEHLGLSVSVDEVSLKTASSSDATLEADLDRALNSLLQYFTTAAMRPTVTKLISSAVAGQGRDALNGQIQRFLVTPPAKECAANAGFGSAVLSDTLMVVGGSALLMAAVPLIELKRRVQCVRSTTRCRISSALVAFAGICFIAGGFTGFPFRAGLHMYNLSGGGANVINYMYTVNLADPLKPMPYMMVFVTGGIVFNVVRLVAILGCSARGYASCFAAQVRCLSAVGTFGLGAVYYFLGTQIMSFCARVLQYGGAAIDLGVQFNATFYVFAFGLYLADLTSLSIYSRCSASVKIPETPRQPPLLGLLGLVLGIPVLLVLPWVTLWTHHYGGLLEDVFHYQEDSFSQDISLMSIVRGSPTRILNPHELGVGAYLVQFVLVLHFIAAPVLHALLSLYVGVSLRLGKRLAGVPCQSARTPFAAGLLEAGQQAQTVESNGEGRTSAKSSSSYFSYALVLARMWSGADHFALAMILIVPELGPQMGFMTAQVCDPLKAPLARVGLDCVTMDGEITIYLVVMCIAGLMVRVCAELCAHAPLRGKLFLQPAYLSGTPPASPSASPAPSPAPSPTTPSL